MISLICLKLIKSTEAENRRAITRVKWRRSEELCLMGAEFCQMKTLLRFVAQQCEYTS